MYPCSAAFLFTSCKCEQKKVKVASGGFEFRLNKMFFPSTGLGHGHKQKMIFRRHCWPLLWKINGIEFGKSLYSHI